MLEMIKKIQEAEDYASLGAASKEQITDAENELKLKFSEDYKEYLSTFGAATFCGKELTQGNPPDRRSAFGSFFV